MGISLNNNGISVVAVVVVAVVTVSSIVVTVSTVADAILVGWVAFKMAMSSAWPLSMAALFMPTIEAASVAFVCVSLVLAEVA